MNETIARVIVLTVGIVLTALLVRYHRAGGAARRVIADPWIELLRRTLITPAAIGTLVWLAYPSAMSWSTIPLPAWTRWLGVVVLAKCVVGVVWAFATLGRNFATTLVVQEEHTLVTTGPYASIRHPMYTFGFLLFLGLFLVTQSWVIGAFGVAGMGVVMTFRVPKEEAMLAEEFGDDWEAYRRRSGRFVPRLVRKSD